MALFETFRTPNNVDPNNGELTVADAGLIQIVAGTVTFNYFGSFLYDGNGALSGGTHTGFEMHDSANGGLQVRITGLNLDALTFFATLISGNAAALEQYWFSGNDTVIGTSGDDFLQAYAGVDSISAGAGNDVLEGSDDLQVDTLAGGTGDDVYGVGGTQHASNDVVVEAAGAGHDTVITLTSYTLGANVEDLLLTGNGNHSGGGNALDNKIEGNAGSNLLEGFAGNDTLDGGNGFGTDTLRGGAGDDTYLVRIAGTVVDEGSGSGVDTVRSSTSFTLGAGIENLVLLDGLPFMGVGNALANVITGNNGDDTLDGGAGADTLNGGTGNDLFIVDNVGDVITDAGGNDTVRVTLEGYTLGGAGIENIVLAGFVSSATGNAFGNSMTGNAAGNQLYGQGGNDTLDGAAGADTLVGGDGDDTYLVDQLGDSVVELANGGNDHVITAISYTLGAQVEKLTLTAAGKTGRGNGLANQVSGTSGVDTLDGGGGADTLIGGGGNDTYIVDDAGDVIVGGPDNADTVQSSVSYVLANGSGVERLTLTGAANINGTGNDDPNIITGNAGANLLVAVRGDTLVGGAGNDTLQGSNDSDRLDGGTGADTMSGGFGFDVYTVDDANDVVQEVSVNHSDRYDLVRAWVSYALSEHVEWLTLMGDAAINATGTSASGEILTGNDAANILDSGGGFNEELYGLGGDDLLLDGGGMAKIYGGTGNDTYDVQFSLSNWVIEEAGGGVDTVRARGNWTLGPHFENLVLLDSAISGSGNAQANHITGNGFGNFIDGGGGADTMAGGHGDDQYHIDSAGDVIIELDGQGYDSIVTHGISVSLAGTSIERVHGELSGSADLDIIGNAADNFLRGSYGVNFIDGGAGADTMTGYFGDDIFVVDNAGDAIWEFDGEGTDWAWSHRSAYTLESAVENLRLVGAAEAGTGNAAANIILGSTGANILDGGDGFDTIWGGLGDDTLIGGAGWDTLDGDAGNDVAVYASSRAVFVVTRNGGTVSVMTLAGTDVLTGVDAIQFSDELLVLNSNFATGSVTVSGTPTEGHVLNANVAQVADADGIGALNYQWFRGDTQIAGAAGASYQLGAADIGQSVSVRVRFIDGVGNTESLWSPASAPIIEGDHTPPTALHFSPADEAAGVARNANIVVQFSEAIARGTGTIALTTGAGTLVESFAVETSNRIAITGDTVTIDPSADLAYLTDYKLVFSPGNVTDLAGNPYAGTSAYNFLTLPEPDTTAPVLTGFVPTHGGPAVPVLSNFMLLFSEDVLRGTGTIVLKTAAGAVVETFDAATSSRIAIDGDALVIDPTFSLLGGSSYRVEVGAGAVVDAGGNALAASGPYTFTTASPVTSISTDANETITGSAISDHIFAMGGNDVIHGGGGNDVIDGGSGLDRAVFSGARSSFTVTRTQTGFQVTENGIDDVTTITNVERLVFNDALVAVDIAGNGGQAYRLYQAAFDRVPDPGGLGFQINALDIGFGITDISANFIESPEFHSTYGTLTDKEFVRQLYLNVLGREPDEGGWLFHEDNLSRGLPRNYLLAQFSESPENQLNVIGAIETGMVYVL